MRILYVAKEPPGRSGVARYAGEFVQVLQRLGEVSVLVTGHESDETSGLRSMASTLRRLDGRLRHSAVDLVVVELSGQGIAEFVAAARVLLGRRRSALWVTVHDSPEVTGGLFWFGPLKGRGLRRVAAGLSRTPGRRIERWLLERADVVACLSEGGAEALRSGYGLAREVVAIPHVKPRRAARPKRDQIFIPGPVGADAVAEALDAIVAVGLDSRVVVGASSQVPETARHVEALGLSDRVEFTGFVPLEVLDDLYATSLVVLYWYAAEDHRWSGSNTHASSSILIDALSNGCVVVTNAPRGSGAYLVDGANAVSVVAGVATLRDALGRLVEAGVVDRLAAGARESTAALDVPAVADDVGRCLRAAGLVMGAASRRPAAP